MKEYGWIFVYDFVWFHGTRQGALLLCGLKTSVCQKKVSKIISVFPICLRTNYKQKYITSYGTGMQRGWSISEYAQNVTKINCQTLKLMI